MAKIKLKKTKATKKKAAKPNHKRPAEVEKNRIGHTVGVKSGKGVSQTWSILLAANVKAKLTDGALCAAMKKEFPKRKNFQPVGRIRSFFNRGVQGYGNPVGENLRGTPRESFAYDAKGKKTDSVDWGQDKKPSATLSRLAKARAAAQWAAKAKQAAKKGKKKQPTSDGKSLGLGVRIGKPPAKKAVLKKKTPAKPSAATAKAATAKAIAEVAAKVAG